MREIEKFKEHILKEYPRLTKEDKFTFSCHKGVPCFNACCGDVNIFLTPYDIIRLRKNLGISSTELLKKYTISPFDKNLHFPVLLLKMNDDARKSCPFVGKQGCTVYPDRPWACRMYPLGLASPGDNGDDLNEEFYFLLKEDVCKGFNENHEYTVAEWLRDQGIEEYNKNGEYFKDVTTHRFFREGNKLNPQQIEMFFMACYDPDRFRRFIFESSFFDKFDVDDATKNKIKTDDIALLEFAVNWLRFAFFGEKTMSIKEDIAASKKEQLKDKIKDKNSGK